MVEPLSWLDVSTINTYRDCQRKMYFRYRLHRTSSRRSTATEFGESWHSGMDAWHTTRDVTEAKSAFSKKWGELGGDSVDDTLRTDKRGHDLLKQYATKYPDEPFTILATEHPFLVDVPGTKVKFAGRIDKIVKDSMGGTRVMDHKTTSRMGIQLTKRSKPNLQTLGYIWFAKTRFPNCYSTIWDYAGVYSDSSRKTIDDKFLRVMDTFTDQEIDEFPQLFRYAVEDIERSIREERWVPHFESCLDYGECAYRQICTMPKQMWTSLLEKGFAVKKWDPSKGELDVGAE